MAATDIALCSLTTRSVSPSLASQLGVFCYTFGAYRVCSEFCKPCKPGAIIITTLLKSLIATSRPDAHTFPLGGVFTVSSLSVSGFSCLSTTAIIHMDQEKPDSFVAAPSAAHSCVHLPPMISVPFHGEATNALVWLGPWNSPWLPT